MLNPKFRLGEKVVVGDGLIVGTISDIVYNSQGFQYMLVEYPELFPEHELQSLEGSTHSNSDVVTIELDDDDDNEINQIERLDIVRVKGIDALFVVRKVEGENAYIINVSNANEIMYPVSELELEEDLEKINRTVNPELIDTIDDMLGFEIGDLVVVKGYNSIFTIVDHNEDKTEFMVKQYLLEDVTSVMFAYPEGMRLADVEEVEAYEEQAIIPREFEPVDKKLEFLKTPKKGEQVDHRS